MIIATLPTSPYHLYYLLHMRLLKRFHIFIYCFLIFLNVYFWEREYERGRGRGREAQKLKQAPGSELSEPSAGLEPTNCEVMTWAEVQGLTDWATQTPLLLLLLLLLLLFFFFFYNHQANSSRCTNQKKKAQRLVEAHNRFLVLGVSPFLNRLFARQYQYIVVTWESWLLSSLCHLWTGPTLFV